MAGKRFLRDRVLDNMLDEIRSISEKVTDTEFPSFIFSQSISAISEMYETNKVVLQHLEDAIEKMRETHVEGEILETVVESAAHIQIGLMSIHSALKGDLDSLMDSIETLKDSLSILKGNEDSAKK